MIDKLQRVIGEGGAQIVLKEAAVLCFGMHVCRVKAVHAPPRIFRGVEGKVCVSYQRIRCGAIVRAEGYADGRADHNLRFLDQIGLRQRGDNCVCQYRELMPVGVAGQHHLEFVSAQSTDNAAIPDQMLEPAADLAQQCVTCRMPHGIVHVFEAIEIEQEKRTFTRVTARTQHRLLQRTLHLHPVGKAGE